MREVTLKIKVNDAEVKQGEASLNRLNTAAKNVGTSNGNTQQDKLANFIKSWGDDSKKAATGIKEADVAIEGVTAASKQMAPAAEAAAGGLGRLGGFAGPVGAAIAGIVVVIAAVVLIAVKLGQEVFKLAKEFADYGLAIGKAMDETGLAAETVSGLTHEAERQGKSFDLLKGPMNEFRKNIGQAAAGSADARAKLNLLGIDGTKSINNIDAAFKTAVENIIKLPAGIERATAGFAVFGPEFSKLSPFIASFNGDIDKAIKKADELGIMLSGKDVSAAKEFNRAYEDVQKVLRGLTITFGREFLPNVKTALEDFTKLLITNKSTILDWAKWSADSVKAIYDWWVDVRKAAKEYNDYILKQNPALAEAARQGQIRRGIKPDYYENTPLLPVDPNVQNAVPTRIQGIAYDEADLAAMEALRQEAAKLQKEREAAAKAELSAQIQIFANHITGVEKLYDDSFKKITEGFKETGNVSQYQQTFDELKQWYGQQINELVPGWENLVKQQTLTEKDGQNQRYLAYSETQKKIEELGKKTLDFEDQATKAINDAKKRASADYLKNLETATNREIEIHAERNQTDIATQKANFDLKIISEKEYINRANKLQLDSLTFQKSELQKFLNELSGNKDKEAEVRQRIAVLGQKITQQEITNSDRVREVLKKEQEILNDLLKQYQEYKQSLEDQFATVLRGNRPLSVYEETLRDIQRDYKDLSQPQKDHLLGLAAQIDAVEELNRQHAELKEFFRESLTYIFEGDLDGLIRSITNNFKDKLIDQLSGIFATSILDYDPDKTNDATAKPIVGKLNKTNEILERIAKAAGAPPPVPGMGGGGISSFLTGILGSLGGGGSSGTLVSNGGSGSYTSRYTGGGSGFDLSQILGNGTGANGSGGSGGLGGIFGNLKNLFSSKEGGLFAERGGSKLAGYIGGAGDIAAMIGGAIGGRVGGIMQSVGSFASFGAAFGPWGAAIGAGVGLLVGLLGGDPKRKKDKKENIPALNKGFTEAISQLNQILADARSLRIDPDEAIKRAGEIRGEIAGGFGIKFESKKYQKQSRTMIASKLAEADTIIRLITESANIGRGAADRNKRILPEFAAGHYFADYFKPNGLLPGMFDGADNILAMISRGEMVLNPNQQSRVRAAAGHDVFAGAGIPNYPKAVSSPKMATGGIAGSGLSLSTPAPIVNMQPVIYIEGVAIDDKVRAFMVSDTGKRVQIDVNRKLKQSGDIK